MDNQFESAEALAMREAMRRRMAARAATPSWYPPLYGLGCGAIVASIALPVPLIAPAVALCSLLIITGYAAWTRISGLSVSGYRRGRTRPITIAVMTAFALFGAGADLLRFVAGIGWGPLALRRRAGGDRCIRQRGLGSRLARRYPERGVSGVNIGESIRRSTAPLRLQVCALLSATDEAEYALVREETGVSESVLSKHVRQLRRRRLCPHPQGGVRFAPAHLAGAHSGRPPRRSSRICARWRRWSEAAERAAE